MPSEGSPPGRGEQVRSGFTIADGFTALRIPLAIAFVLVHDDDWRVVILVVASVSDLLDGYLARRFGSSSLGSFLDPVADKLFMAAAFALTLAYLGEQCSARDAASAFAAYITGNVASNLVGRLIAAGIADHLGLAANFYLFALLNLAGAVLVFFTLRQTAPMSAGATAAPSPLAAWLAHLRNGPVRATFAIGFCILFAFIGTFTYVNFVLVREPLAVGPMTLGFVYFVFLPSILTTPLAGRFAHRFGTRPTMWGALAIAAAGLPLLLLPSLAAVIAGMVLVAVGTFFAQATATGFVSRAATVDRGSASGIYLACYFFGGLVGSAVLGQLFDRFGWTACVVGIALALAVAALLAFRIKIPTVLSETHIRML